MNEIVTLDKLVDRLSAVESISRAFAEKLIIDYFSIVEEGLKRDGVVTIKSLGKFVKSDGQLRFLADDAVASRINDPFECFQPIELDDDEVIDVAIPPTDDRMADEANVVESTVIDEPAQTLETTTETDIECDEVSADMSGDGSRIECVEDEATVNEAVTADNASDEVVDNATDIQADVDTISSEDEVDYEYVRPEYSSDKTHRWRYFICGAVIGAVVGFGAAWFVLRDLAYADSKADSAGSDHENVEDLVSADSESMATESVDEIADVKPVEVVAATEASPEESAPIVTETVRAGNFLATMARRHYGRYEFWVYIYEENKAKLDNPDLIEPGTEVVIPSASKYSIDKTDPESVRRAEQLAIEIYARFNRK